MCSKTLTAAYENALIDGGIPQEMKSMIGGLTALNAILDCGEGPVVALRFDMDALPVSGCMHACGHDGHMAVGLTTARILSELRPHLKGTVKILFQPAEEGVRGAKAMTDAGLLDDVDFFLAGHVLDRKSVPEGHCDLIPAASSSLATTKLDVTFYGKAAHAGICPELGINVLIPLADAIPKLLALPDKILKKIPEFSDYDFTVSDHKSDHRTDCQTDEYSLKIHSNITKTTSYSDPVARLNIGTVTVGSGRNVVPDKAFLEMEVRGSNSEICRELESEAVKILQEAASSGKCRLEITVSGSAPAIQSSQELAARIQSLCSNHLTKIQATSYLSYPFQASEDVAWMMERVHAHNGQACFMFLLNSMAGPLHSPEFELEKDVLWKGAAVYAASVYKLLS